MKTGRNDPCPCGNGKKYKKCCAGRSALSMLQDMKEDIHNLIGSQSFESIEEVQAVLDQYQQQKNEVPVDDFHGLSSEQMHRFLHMPFETPELVTFPPVLEKEPESKAAFILSMLIKGIGGDGIKLTAKGNLSRKFCQQAFEKYQPRYPDLYRLKITIHSETNFEPLHAIRLTAQLAGLVRKYKGRLLLTKKCKKALDRHGLRAPYLFCSMPISGNSTGDTAMVSRKFHLSSNLFCSRSTCSINMATVGNLPSFTATTIFGHSP